MDTLSKNPITVHSGMLTEAFLNGDTARDNYLLTKADFGFSVCALKPSERQWNVVVLHNYSADGRINWMVLMQKHGDVPLVYRAATEPAKAPLKLEEMVNELIRMLELTLPR